MTEILRIVPNHQGGDVDSGRFEVVGQISEAVGSLRDAVISDDGIGQDQNLTLV